MKCLALSRIITMATHSYLNIEEMDIRKNKKKKGCAPEKGLKQISFHSSGCNSGPNIEKMNI